ncbi:hypothetical protein Caci_6935 [Catenulispora acidiphila DSM 44928]|uniref:Uncharacterized protein n=1 Tax=Catenulispora acidiphila (strain DSM 44928 / JCM 14897 / NBRC 102108 / NRRL B-24433 / ID139908) TaxID=479433 RepID=C7Q3K3_CATAD|nr:hypothetical protein [Catenulispora acidiphila]ACU75768.1 hypothetical protein Caci_6935 [Catenulispora acidiphila DSM 44928]
MRRSPYTDDVQIGPSPFWVGLFTGIPALAALGPAILVRHDGGIWWFIAVAFVLMGTAVMRNCLRVRSATLSQRSVIRFKDFDLALLTEARLFHAAGRGNSWWEMRLRDARGRRMVIRLNGFRSTDRQQFMRALQPYLDRPQAQVEGPFAEASAGGLWWPRRG